MPEPRTDPVRARARILALSAERDRMAAYADAMFRLGYQLGAGIITDPEAGYALGFDTGLSARQDTRAFVHAVRNGLVDGTRARREWLAQIFERDDPPCDLTAATSPQRSPSTPTPSGATTRASSPPSYTPTRAGVSAETG